MTGNVEGLPAMTYAEMRRQPREVWRCVEYGVCDLRRRLGSQQIAGIGLRDIVRGGWLKDDPDLIARLQAGDIPIGRLFTACATAQRDRG
jgi:hypothetical protein